MSGRACEPVVVENSNSSGPFVIVCYHALNRITDDCRQFGFAEDALQTYAWAPGVLAVTLLLSAELDALLIGLDVSRLVIDCNRAPDVAARAGYGMDTHADGMTETGGVPCPRR